MFKSLVSTVADILKLGLVYLLALFACVYCNDDTDGGQCRKNYEITSMGPVLRIQQGPLVGKIVTVGNKQLAAFLGIPYAHSTAGERRFEKPYPLDHWSGILNATRKPRPCMQYSTRNFSWIPTSTPSEDCLGLNVWTPSKCFGDKLPVLVWFYGGGFSAGSTDVDLYDGSVLASQSGAVVVSINYRVGIFGFLNAGTDKISGNAGLLDQQLALQWVKGNIEYFGGDPGSVTIMGESAGAWSVSLHLLSPMSRNLFRGAIMESGTANHPLIVDSPKTAYYKANIFARTIGCLEGNSSIESDPAILECINGTDPKVLAAAENVFTSKFTPIFLPTYGNAFLPASPLKAIQEGKIAPVDILLGNNKNEGTIFLNYISPEIFKLDSEPLLNLEAAQQIIHGLFRLVPRPKPKEIYQQYFQNVSGTNRSEIIDTIANAFGDYLFNCPALFFAEKAPNALFYWYTHRSSNEQTAQWLGVTHFDEIAYVFGRPIEDALTYTPEDKTVSEDIINKWITFAQEGHPLEEENRQDWPKFTAENRSVYELNPTQGGAFTHPRITACRFWRPYM